MNLRSLEYFLVAAEEMSFSRAAERLFLTQQALSSHIKRLEEEYDAVLFHRKPTLALTQEGEELKFWAEKILTAEKNLRANLHDIGTDCRGRLRVGVSRLRAFRMMPEIMERYRRLYPNVSIEVVDGATYYFSEQLENNKLDMYIGVNVETGMNEVNLELVGEAIWTCSSRTALRRFFETDEALDAFLANDPDIRTLPGLPLLVTLPSNRIRRQLDKYYYDAGARPNIYFESNSQHLLCILAEKGMGLAVVSPVILYNNWQAVTDKNSGLCAFPLCRDLPENTLSLVYRKDDPMPQYARDFIRVVKDVFTVYGRLLDFEEQTR